MAQWDLTRWQNERTSHWLVRTWADGLQQVLTVAGSGEDGAEIPVMALPPEPEAWEQWQDPVWLSLDADIATGARLSVGCPAATEQALAELIGGEGLDAAAVRQAYAGLVQHSTQSLADAATEQTTRKTSFSAPAECSRPASASLGVTCHFAIAGESHSLALVPNALLLVTLLSEEVGASPGSDQTALAAIQGDAGIIPELALSPHARQNLEMLLDVDLELSVSFGRTTLVLQEVLKLSSGSIVELNRSASDPVELLVNGSVVARGEVVVVDGNYGIRITEVVSPRERIRSLL